MCLGPYFHICYRLYLGVTFLLLLKTVHQCLDVCSNVAKRHVQVLWVKGATSSCNRLAHVSEEVIVLW